MQGAPGPLARSSAAAVKGTPRASSSIPILAAKVACGMVFTLACVAYAVLPQDFDMDTGLSVSAAILGAACGAAVLLAFMLVLFRRPAPYSDTRKARKNAMRARTYQAPYPNGLVHISLRVQCN